MSRAQTVAVYLTAASSGAVVMALELLGTRVVGSFFGTSVYVWGSLISVTLVAMAAGYAAGGALASKIGGLRVYHVCAVGGAALALVPSLSPKVLEATNGLGARLGALASASLLFFVPIAVLSMVGPLSIGMLVRDPARSARVSGLLLAVSTIGSVTGTLVLAFFLLPIVRVAHVFSFCAAMMFLIALGGLLILGPRRGRRDSSAAALLFVGGVCSWLGQGGASPQSERFRVLSESENHYGRLRVVDEGAVSIRWLVADTSLISAARLNDTHPVFEYLNLLEVLIGAAPAGKRALVIGLGAGYVPLKLEEHGFEVDSIEINPGVLDAARTYFDFKTKGKVIIGDARHELRNLPGKYDFIVHDCFSGGAIPAHVLTLEMMREIQAHLTEGGVLVTSFFGDLSGEDSAAVKTISKTLKSVFAETRVLVPKREVQPIDVAFVSSNRPVKIDPVFVTRLSGALQAYAARLGELEVAVDDSAATVATDDLNPFEMLQARKAESYRNFLVEKLGVEFFL